LNLLAREETIARKCNAVYSNSRALSISYKSYTLTPPSFNARMRSVILVADKLVVVVVAKSYGGHSPLRSLFISWSRLQHAPHAGHLLPLLNHASSVSKNTFQCLHHALKAALRTLFLREACDREVGFAAVLENSEELHGQADGTDVQSYEEPVSPLSRIL